MSIPDIYNQDPSPQERTGRAGQYATKEERAEINFIPTEGELLSTFIARTAIAIEQLDKKAWQQHVMGNREWFCHKNLMGCFICQHTQFLYIMRNAFKALGENTPLSGYKFHFIDNDHTDRNHPYWTIILTSTDT